MLLPHQFDDVTLLFQDWGVTVMLRHIEVTYDPATGQTTEATVDTPLLAVIGPISNHPTLHSATAHRQVEQTFLVRTSSLPVNFDPADTRVVSNSVQYRIQSFTRTALTDLALLQAITD